MFCYHDYYSFNYVSNNSFYLIGYAPEASLGYPRGAPGATLLIKYNNSTAWNSKMIISVTKENIIRK